MAFVACLTFYEFPSRRPFRVDPLDVILSSIEQPPPTEITDPNASSVFRLTSTGAVRYHVQGSWENTRELVKAWRALALYFSIFIPSTGQEYQPVFVCSGGGTALPIGVFSAFWSLDSLTLRMNVLVRGSFAFAPAVAGVSETVTMTLPTNATPPANFTSAQDLAGGAGMQGVHAATDFCTQVQATVGALTAEVDVLNNVASSPVNVTFNYSYLP